MKKVSTSPRHTLHSRGLRARVWNAIGRRYGGTFTVAELLASVSDGTQKSAPTNVARYLRALMLCGLLKATKVRCKHTGGYLRYRLAQKVGPLAPVYWSRDRAVYDPNSGVVYPLKEPTPATEGAHD